MWRRYVKRIVYSGRLENFIVKNGQYYSFNIFLGLVIIFE